MFGNRRGTEASTATTIAKLKAVEEKKAKQLAAQKKAQEVTEAIVKEFEPIQREPELMPSQQPIFPASSGEETPLSLALKRLQDKLVAYDTDIKDFEAYKETLLEKAVSSNDTEVTETKASSSIRDKINIIVADFESVVGDVCEIIKEGIEWPDSYLKELIVKTSQTMKPFENRLNELIQKLNDKTIEHSADEDRKLRLDICDVSIEILNGLIGLLNGTKSEIDYCVEARAAASEAVKVIAVLAINYFLPINIPIPAPSENTEGYQLYNQVSEELKEASTFLVDTHGEVLRAKDVLQNKVAANKEAAAEGSPSVIRSKGSVFSRPSSPAPSSSKEAFSPEEEKRQSYFNPSASSFG